MNKITKFYEVGDVTKAISKGHSSGNEKKGTSSTYLKLAELFASPRGQEEPVKIPLPEIAPTTNLFKKQNKNFQSPSKKSKGNTKSKEDKPDEDNSEKPNKSKKKFKLKFESKLKGTPEDNAKSVFVGNLPNAYNRKKIAKLFKDVGTIESVRIRSVARKDPEMMRRLAVIKQDFHPHVKTVNAYVRFKDENCAAAALKLNGIVVDGFHLRVDMAEGVNNLDHKSSVFLGNLHYQIDEETLRSHFEDCGEISSVRIIRDNATRMGKGFGYIQFKDGHGVELALKLNSSELMGRFIRVKRCERVDKMEAKKSSKFSHKSKNFKKDATTANAKRRIIAKNKRLGKKTSRVKS